VYIATDRTVHRLVTTTGGRCHRHKNPESTGKVVGHRHPRGGATATLFGAPTDETSRWITVGGAPPPYVRCHTDMSGVLTESCSKGVTTLFACGLINRGGGQPWPPSWHF
jgi:hypothetical protein